MKAAWFCLLAALLGSVCAGCFYPPIEKPPTAKQDRIVLSLPYDLAWQAVNAVVAQNGYQVIVRDPNRGLIETQTNHFTLRDADCGQLKSVAGRYPAEPNQAASAVYNFSVKPNGKEASIVEVRATFSAPLHVPLHPPRDVQCVSRGTQEARLLKEVAQQARLTHRPVYKKPRT